jgi:hypothetical protein
MTNVTDSNEEYQPQDWRCIKGSIPTRTSVWIGLAAIVACLLSYVAPKKQRSYSPGSDHDENHRSEKITLAYRQRKSGGGLLSLAFELLGAVAIRLLQRYFKTWSSTLIVALKDAEPRTSAGLHGKTPPKVFIISPSSKYHQRRLRGKALQEGIVALFKNTASEWIKTNVRNSVRLWLTLRFSLAPWC